MNIQKTKFCIEGQPEWKGYHYPAVKWNGWACPYFTEETARQISDWYNSHPEKNVKCKWIGSELSIIFTNEDNAEPEVYRPVNIQYEGKTIEVWPVGSHYWAWIENK